MELKFVYKLESSYENESENLEIEWEQYVEGDDIDQILQDAASNGENFNDEDVINFDAQSDLIETINSLEKIFEIDGNKETDVTDKYLDKYYEFY